MDYIIILFIWMLQIVLSGFNQPFGNWGLVLALGLGLYFFLSFIESRIIKDSEVKIKTSKHIITMSVSIYVYSLMLTLFNFVYIIYYVASTEGSEYMNEIVTSYLLKSITSSFGNALVLGANVILFLVVKRLVFKIALKLKKTKI